MSKREIIRVRDYLGAGKDPNGVDEFFWLFLDLFGSQFEMMRKLIDDFTTAPEGDVPDEDRRKIQIITEESWTNSDPTSPPATISWTFHLDEKKPSIKRFISVSPRIIQLVVRSLRSDSYSDIKAWLDPEGYVEGITHDYGDSDGYDLSHLRFSVPSMRRKREPELEEQEGDLLEELQLPAIRW